MLILCTGLLGTLSANIVQHSAVEAPTKDDNAVLLHALTAAQSLVHKTASIEVIQFGATTIPALVAIVSRPRTRCFREHVTYAALCVLHELVLQPDLTTALVDAGTVDALSFICVSMARRYEFARVSIHGLCELLYRLKSQNLSKPFVAAICMHGVVPVLLSAIQTEDTNLILVSLHLVQLIVALDVARDEFRGAMRFTEDLIHLLSSTPAGTQQVILQILGTLTLEQEDYRWRLVRSGIGAKLAVSMRSSVPPVAQVSLFILHDLSMLGEEACVVLGSSMPVWEALASYLAQPHTVTLTVKVAETVGFLCGVSHLRYDVAQPLSAIVIALLTSSSAVLQRWGGTVAGCGL